MSDTMIVLVELDQNHEHAISNYGETSNLDGG